MNLKNGLKMVKAWYKLIKSSVAQTGSKVKRTPPFPIVSILSHTDKWTTCTYHLLFWLAVFCRNWKLASQYTEELSNKKHINLVYLSSSCFKQLFLSRNFMEAEGIEINRFIAFIFNYVCCKESSLYMYP